MKVPVSVVIVAKNEELNMDDCLGSVSDWASEIVVVDDQSSDRTCEISRKYTDKIFSRKMDVEGRHRNWAYAQAKNKWVLSLDADEKVTPELKEEISRAIKLEGFVAYSVPLRNYIGNYWVRHGGWYPAGKVKLFKKDKFKYEEVGVHPRVFIDGECGHLKCDIIHNGFRDIEQFVHKVNKQTTLEAIKWIDTNRKMTLGHMLWRAVDRFFRRYLRKKSYKDGMYGFVIAFFDTLYQILSYIKYREISKERKLK